uniref:Trichoplein keratin filament-binding protein n=1 Tax=Sinocyclocheilus grahami TaxID=75366 RepID=A0A672PLD9_SINGR
LKQLNFVSWRFSMSAFQREQMKEEKQRKLQERREHLRIMLQEERDQLEAELRNVCPDRATLTRQVVEKTDYELLTSGALFNPTSQCLKCLCVQVETELCKDHVVSQWQVQQQERKQADERTQEEKQHFENEYERTRREALERMKEEEEKRRQEEKKRAEDLHKQMEELQLREQEAERLKQEQEALMSQRWELEKLEDERKRMEESRRKTEFGHFLTRQYRAQLKRRAQQVQEELEADRKILAALLEGGVEEQRMEKARRERAVADAAWMKRVIEEQLQLEREREAEFDILYREEAQRVWEKREAEWEKERRARERLMREVRQCTACLKLKDNRSVVTCLNHGFLKTPSTVLFTYILHENNFIKFFGMKSPMFITAALLQEREGLRQQEEELNLETERMIRRGYKERIHSRPRSAWT